MVANSSISLVNLDFDSYKADLIESLRAQNVFKDYDFEGSNMNVLLDVLALNTFKNAFYLNMAISEGFLDSAQLVNSVRSHAKELNYTPRSIQSARATVTATFTASATNQPYIIEKGQTFSSIVKNNTYVFSVPETLTVASANTTFTFTTDIYEGNYFKDSYVYVSTEENPIPTFAITNPNVDTRSLTVVVYEDGSSIGTTFRKTDSLLDLTNQSQVYFLQISAITGNYEITFGDGILGKKPKENSLIVVDYRISLGSVGNGAGAFVCNFDPTGSADELTSSVSVVTNTSAVGGYDAEDIETTRFYAPRWFQTQERAVVASDYSVLLKNAFPEINSATAYGGEDLDPPIFGSVVVALDIAGLTNVLPDSLNRAYYNFLKKRCPITITPVFKMAEHTFIYLDSIVRYNVNVSSESLQRVKTLVLAAISNYNSVSLSQFNATFRLSDLSRQINDSDVSILSNSTKIKLYKYIYPVIGVNSSFNLQFGVPLVGNNPQSATTHPVNQNKTLSSDEFVYKGQTCTFEDDGVGNVRIVTLTTGGKYSTVDIVGTIGYNEGRVDIGNVTFEAINGAGVKIFVTPVDTDIPSSRNNILNIESNVINVTVEPLSE